MTVHLAHDDGAYRCYTVTASGKGRAYLGCEHATPRQAIAHSDSIDDRPASRPGSDDLAGAGASTSRDARVQPEVPELTPDASRSSPAAAGSRFARSTVAAGVRTCEGCDRPLPADSRPNRRTHGSACRVAALRRRSAAKAADGASFTGSRTDVTVSARQRPSLADVLAAHVQDVIAACNPELRSSDPTTSEAARGPLLRAASRDAGPSRARLTDNQVEAIRARRAAGESRSTIAADFGISVATVTDITTGRSWRTPMTERLDPLVSPGPPGPDVPTLGLP